MSRKDGVSLLVGYCDECADHQADSASRVLAPCLASALLALALAAGLPLLWPWLGLSGLMLSVCLASALPALTLLVPNNRPTARHSARGPALFWGTSNGLLCTSPHYGEAVAQLNSGELKPVTIRERTGAAWLATGPVLGLAAASLSFFAYHPLLRILNLGAERVRVAIDGRALVAVDPTSNESPSAGALTRVPTGSHTLSVNRANDGALLERTVGDFRSGAVHLFAISVMDACFWLETTGYGREQRTLPNYYLLSRNQHFWALPPGIDTWFEANQERSTDRSSTSGGVLTAIRQAPCRQAPPGIRPPL